MLQNANITGHRSNPISVRYVPQALTLVETEEPRSRLQTTGSQEPQKIVVMKE